jgi:hypothetical protein
VSRDPVGRRNRSRFGGQPRPIEMIGAPSRQPAVDRLVPRCVGMTGSSVPQAHGNSTTLMSGTFNVEGRIHRKLRQHPDGRASPVPAGRLNRATGDPEGVAPDLAGEVAMLASLGLLSVRAARRPWPTLIEPTSPRGGKTKWGQQCLMCGRGGDARDRSSPHDSKGHGGTERRPGADGEKRPVTCDAALKA